MPTYEYECTKCGEIVEVFQPITEPARRRLKKTDPRPCDCNAAVRRRIGTGGGVIFRGSGFYQTDYRSENYKKAAKSESQSGKKDDAAGGGEKGGDANKPKKDSASKPSRVT